MYLAILGNQLLSSIFADYISILSKLRRNTADIQGIWMDYHDKILFLQRKNDKNMKLNRIRAVLEDKGISQTWLAKKLGRSFSTVNAYVCNRSQPNLTTLLEIAQLLSVDMKELHYCPRKSVNICLNTLQIKRFSYKKALGGFETAIFARTYNS